MNVTCDNLKKWMMNTRPCKEELTLIPVWVKIHDVPIQVFSEDCISLIAYEIGKPIILDSFTSLMCLELWGQSLFARCLIEIKADEALKDSITMGIPFPEGIGFTKETIRVEYEWKPPRCEQCKIFGHMNDQCPKDAMTIPTVFIMMDSKWWLTKRKVVKHVLLLLRLFGSLSIKRCRVIKVANAGIIFSEDVAHMAVGLLIDVLTQDVPLSMIRKHLRMKADFAT
nr:zinc knuckle CX2CX4HX4C [Tanacetum cinerariifolium]